MPLQKLFSFYLTRWPSFPQRLLPLTSLCPASDNELMSLMARDNVEKGQDTRISDYVTWEKGEEARGATRGVKPDLIFNLFVLCTFRIFGFWFACHHKTSCVHRMTLLGLSYSIAMPRNLNPQNNEPLMLNVT